MSTTVLIVNYRGYDDLTRCLDSLGPTLGADDEVIVVDNETDETQLSQVAARHPRVVLIPREDNLGFSAGINLAARRARSPFLLLLNPDATVEGPVLRTMEQWLRENPRTLAAGPRVLNRDGTTQPSARRFPGLSTIFGGRSTWLTKRLPNNWWSRRNLLGLDSSYPIDVDWVSGSCLMTRRDAFESLGGLDERFFMYWEDADYCRRIVKSGGRCTYLPDVSVRHLGGGSAKYALPRAIRSFHESAYRLYWKHAGPRGRIVAPLVRAGLHLRGEMRLRRALQSGHSPPLGRLATPVADRVAPVGDRRVIDHRPVSARAPAEAERSAQRV